MSSNKLSLFSQHSVTITIEGCAPACVEGCYMVVNASSYKEPIKQNMMLRDSKAYNTIAD